ncbi:hypothetical protein [Streptomyces niveus]|uniref:hypothetical protein n=1 Tax=Streptomyces niveus TaxID=193462 RepID=UPI00114CE2D8|nr:hypothetical protein [Streptomyces niveus]
MRITAHEGPTANAVRAATGPDTGSRTLRFHAMGFVDQLRGLVVLTALWWRNFRLRSRNRY